MEERRRFVRLDTRLEVAYNVLTSGPKQQGIAKDIGGGGVCLFSDKVLPTGTRLQVAMNVPGREQPVNFTAEVMWSEEYEIISKTEQTRSVEVGVRFIEIAPKDQEAIMQHVILGVKSPRSS